MAQRTPLIGASVLAASLLAAGCGGNSSEAAPSASQGAARKITSGPAFHVATAPSDPCKWIAADEVAAVAGPLSGPPVRVRSAETPTPQADGSACLYLLAAKVRAGRPAIAVQVLLDGPLQFETAGTMMKDLFTRELNEGQPAPAGATPGQPIAAGWDYAGAPGPLDFAGRIGHVGVIVSAQSLEIPRKSLEALAASVRDAVPDRPFAPVVDPGLAELNEALKSAGGRSLDEAVGTSSSQDPCGVISRDEAEAVLGKLAVPPYRSVEDLAFADPAGSSCSYYTGRHRVMVVTPHWRDGRMLFAMVRGVSGLTSSGMNAGGGRSAPIQGPWEQSASDLAGALHFLKGDRMLKISFRTSSTDRAGATRLAARAMQRF